MLYNKIRLGNEHKLIKLITFQSIPCLEEKQPVGGGGGGGGGDP